MVCLNDNVAMPTCDGWLLVVRKKKVRRELWIQKTAKSMSLGATPPQYQQKTGSPLRACDNHGDDHLGREIIHLNVSLDTHINITPTIYFRHCLLHVFTYPCVYEIGGVLRIWLGMILPQHCSISTPNPTPTAPWKPEAGAKDRHIGLEKKWFRGGKMAVFAAIRKVISNSSLDIHYQKYTCI